MNLHRVMFILFALVTYFTFNGEAGARTRHSHHSRHHSVPSPRITETHYVYLEAIKPSFPVTNASAVAYADTDITGLLRSISVPYNPYVVQDTVPLYKTDVLVSEKLEMASYGVPLFILGIILVLTGLYKGYLDDEITFLRVLSRSEWSPTPEVVRGAYRRWQASRDYLQGRNLGVYLRDLSHRTARRFVSSGRPGDLIGRELIDDMLGRMPDKYVARFDIPRHLI